MLSHGDITALSAPPGNVTCAEPGGRSYVELNPALWSRLAWQQRPTYRSTSLSVHLRATRPRGVRYRTNQSLASDEQGPASPGCPAEVTDRARRLRATQRL
ncbi:uncharacterized [Lates japonicus]